MRRAQLLERLALEQVHHLLERLLSHAVAVQDARGRPRHVAEHCARMPLDRRKLVGVDPVEGVEDAPLNVEQRH